MFLFIICIWIAKIDLRGEMNNNILIVEPEKCTGCRTCELVCQTKYKSSRIKLLKNELFDVNIPVLSLQCDLCAGNPLCIKFCVAGALKIVSIEEAALLRKKFNIGVFPIPMIK